MWAVFVYKTLITTTLSLLSMFVCKLMIKPPEVGFPYMLHQRICKKNHIASTKDAFFVYLHLTFHVRWSDIKN